VLLVGLGKLKDSRFHIQNRTQDLLDCSVTPQTFMLPLTQIYIYCHIGSVLQLLATASVDSNSLNLSTLIMEAIRSSVSSVLTRATWRHIPEDDILHSLRRENLKPDREAIVYIFSVVLSL
jgi:hypothetical protein